MLVGKALNYFKRREQERSVHAVIDGKTNTPIQTLEAVWPLRSTT